MTKEQLTEFLSTELESNDQFKKLDISSGKMLGIYPRSVNRVGGNYFFIAKKGIDKRLFIISLNGTDSTFDRFEGEPADADLLEEGISLKRCPLNHTNVVQLQSLFDFTRPILLGIENSVGVGDRLGLANPGHLRAVAGTDMKVIIAQQSIRELERTERTPEEVMNAAVWAVFQEGYRDGFGADADHLKTADDIDLMVKAGYTMYTFDPGAHVVNDAYNLRTEELMSSAQPLDWELLNDTLENLISRYDNISFSISDDYIIKVKKEEILQALVKYGGAVCHAIRLYYYMKNAHHDLKFELELSVDETDSPTTPFEHFLIVNELKRLGIELVSLAPRFIGGFEKGIDYKGDLVQFKEEYIKHVKIAGFLGPYKISYHSGSDKFSVYETVGKLKEGRVHVKTAGTSYLEGLRVIAAKKPDLFREIYDFSRERYEVEKRSYHVSAEINKVQPSGTLKDNELLYLFTYDDVRQVLHVAFGTVLTAMDDSGKYIFKERILQCLQEHEETHYEFLKQHFLKHIRPFL